ncbi:MAG TPA: hypothetical protein VMS74_13855 [Acidimicrobiia bacterium]|nr:hypothetical protein [Acidimicrobiia bacterium]
MTKSARVVVALCLALSACLGGSVPETPSDEASPPDSPEAVFDELVEALANDAFDTAATLTDPAQITVLAIAEGAEPRQVATFSEDDRTAVAANFWSGFSEQLRSTIGGGLGDLGVGDFVRRDEAGAQFATVDLLSTDGSPVRRLVLRNTADGWLVDLLASFPAPLLGLIPGAAQGIRSLGDEQLLADLRSYETSVAFVLADPDADPLLSQAAMAALEAIVR